MSSIVYNSLFKNSVLEIRRRLWDFYAKVLLDCPFTHLRNRVGQVIEEMDSSGALNPTSQMCQLLILGEDRRFHHHPGVDLVGIIRALWRTIFCRQVQGGSTIAMQLVRTLTGNYERTLRRKLREMVLAVRLTRHCGRNRLPSIYLWVAHYGWSMNGFVEACMRLGIDPASATSLEAASIISRLKYPEPRRYDCTQRRRIESRNRYLVSLRRQHETGPVVSAMLLLKHPAMESREHSSHSSV